MKLGNRQNLQRHVSLETVIPRSAATMLAMRRVNRGAGDLPLVEAASRNDEQQIPRAKSARGMTVFWDRRTAV